MLAIQERAARTQQVENFSIESTLPVVGEMMNRQASDDGIEGRLDPPEPVGGTEVGLGDCSPGAELLQAPTGLLHHDRREIDDNPRRLGERFEKALQEDSISRPEVQDARRKPIARPDDANQHLELTGSVGYEV